MQQVGEQPFVVGGEGADEAGQHRGAVVTGVEESLHLAGGDLVVIDHGSIGIGPHPPVVG